MNKWRKLLVALVASVVISIIVIPVPDVFMVFLGTAMIFPVVVGIWFFAVRIRDRINTRGKP
jgi:hypothetical protein